MIPGAPVFSWSTFDPGHALPQGDNSARPVTAGAPAPTSTQGSKRAVEAFRWACRTQDRTEARVLDAGEGA
jgi:hypothetical protein